MNEMDDAACQPLFKPIVVMQQHQHHNQQQSSENILMAGSSNESMSSLHHQHHHQTTASLFPTAGFEFSVSNDESNAAADGGLGPGPGAGVGEAGGGAHGPNGAGVNGACADDDDYDYSSLYFEAIDLCMPLVNDLGAAFPTYNSNSQDGQVQRCNSVPVNLFYFNGGGGGGLTTGGDTSMSDLNPESTSCCGGGGGVGDATATTTFDEADMNGLIDEQPSSARLAADQNNNTMSNTSLLTPHQQHHHLIPTSTDDASSNHQLPTTNLDLLPIFLPSLVINNPDPTNTLIPVSGFDPSQPQQPIIIAAANVTAAAKPGNLVSKQRSPVKSASLDSPCSHHSHHHHHHVVHDFDQGIDLKPLLQNFYSVGYTCLARACGMDFSSKAEIMAHFKEKHWTEINESMENFDEFGKLSYKCVYLKHQSKIPCGKKLDSLNKIANHICKEHPLKRILQPIISPTQPLQQSHPPEPAIFLLPSPPATNSAASLDCFPSSSSSTSSSSSSSHPHQYSPDFIAALNETSGRLKKINICPYEDCMMLFFNESAFKAHKTQDHSGESTSQLATVGCSINSTSIDKRKYFCSICSTTFVRPSHLSTHMKLHENDELKFKCDYCNEAFLKQSLLISHVSKEHKKSDKLFKCTFEGCKKEYMCKMYLDSHISKQHTKPSNECDRFCALCNKEFQAAWLKRQHDEFKHLNNPLFKCLFDGCAKTFETSSKLQRHSRVHLKVKAFKCPHDSCRAEFARNEHLAAHITGVHDCKSSFRYYANLLTHKKTAHSQQQPQQQQSPQSSKLKDAELNEKISRLIMSNSSIIAGTTSTSTTTSSQAIPIANQLIQHHNTIDATNNQMMLGGEVMPSSLSTSCVLVDNLGHATRFDTAIQMPDGSNNLAASDTNTSNTTATTSTNTTAAACNTTSSCCFTCSYCGVKFYEQNDQAYQLHLKSHFDIEKASEKLNKYLLAISSSEKSSSSSSSANIDNKIRVENNEYNNRELIDTTSTTTTTTSTTNQPVIVNQTTSNQANTTDQVFFYPTTTTTSTSSTATNAFDHVDQPHQELHHNHHDSSSSSISLSSSSSSQATDIEITQFINEMTDNLASQHPAAPPPQPPVVPQPTGDFMSSFLGAVSVSAADCFHSSNQHPQQPPISECSSHEPLINVSINSDDDELSASSSCHHMMVAVAHNPTHNEGSQLSGSARTDYKSNHTFIEKNFLKRRQKDFMSMSVNNLTFCNLSNVKKHKNSGVSINFKNEHCARCNSFRQDYLLCEPPPSGRSRFHSSSLQLLFDLSYLKAEISLSIRVRLNSTHTVNLNESGHSNTTLNVNQAALTALSTLKCSFYSQQLHNSTNVNLAKKYMTIVGLSISIVSIVILLAMYFAHKVLRNLPGLILISLGLSLMASQICFLLSSYFTKSFVYAHKHLDNACLSNEFESNDDLKENIAKIIDCYTMATLTHYFYLTFFTWTNTMAYDLYSTLRRLDPNSRAPIKQDESSDRRRFVRFSLYSWLMPALVVSALTAKQFLIDSHAMSYGYRACFVSTNIDLLIFFVLPVALLLALNVYFLGACISMIRLVDKSTGKYLNSDGNSSSTGDDNKRRLVLFIKLFCLTGMTWILGLFSSFSENSFLWYIYILLNSLQGAFILFAFAFNTKTRNLVKKSSAYKAISTAIGSTRSRATMTSDSTI